MPHDQPESEPTRPSATEDALRRLEERLDRASSAAERLLADAAGAAARAAAARQSPGDAQRAGAPREAPADPSRPAGAGQPRGGTGQSSGPDEPPPAGWQTPETDVPDGRRDFELVVQIFESVRDLIPPDLERRLAEALRELLLALRALIDWYLERADHRRREPADVQDIPIA